MKINITVLFVLIFSYIFFQYSFPIAFAAATAPPPKTGQTTSYAARDDGALQPGVAWPSPRFIDNANGSVVDNLTGLIWLKNANCFSSQTWDNALVQAKTLATGACSLTDGSIAGDWHLPNRNELWSLLDYERINPSLPAGHPFTSVQSLYWTGSSVNTYTNTAFYVQMSDSVVGSSGKANSFSVWPVRSAQYGPLTLSPVTNNFASIDTNTLSAPVMFTLSNTGTAALTVSGITIAGSDTNQFSVAAGGSSPCSSLSPVLTPGANCTVNVTFMPTSNGAKFSSLQVSSNAVNSPVLASLSGTGVLPTYIIGTGVTGSGGSISCTSPVEIGASSLCTISPSTGYSLSILTDNGIDVKNLVSGSTYTISNVTAVHTVAATFADITAPAITAFSMPATSTSLTVAFTSFTATDTVGVTGYCISETNSSIGCGWPSSAPTSYTFGSAGISKTLYAFARDAAGNISASASAAVYIDISAPVISDFIIPSASGSLTVPITTFNSTDNIAVNGYCLTESDQSSSCSSVWSSTKPTNFIFSTFGSKTLYAFTKDFAGNISARASASVTITLVDVIAPTISSFVIPATANSLTVDISLSATDNPGGSGFIGYCLSETNSSSGCASWPLIAPTSYTFSAVGSKTLYAFAKDAAGNISTSAAAAVAITDITPPSISAFTIPATSSSLNVAILTFIATDNVGVTGYCLSETNNSSGCAWTSTAPTNFIFSAEGSKILYAFAKDAAGFISTGSSAPVAITLPDITLPSVTSFTIPATSTNLTLAVTTFTATDNIAVTGYCLSETNNSSGCSWVSTAPANFSFSSAGSKTLYAFAKDAAGNISTSASATVTITDITPPSISAFTIPATSSSLTVAILTFIATDNVGVTGYCLSDTNNSSGCVWSSTVPVNFIFSAEGSKTLYAFAKDAAGLISTNASASVTITLPDTTLPSITSFTIPATSTNLTLAVTTFTATDNRAVTGYCLSETSNSSGCSWVSSAPANFTFNTVGSKTLYAFAKDAAGNISASVSRIVLILPIGDIDGDGSTTIADALIALKVSVGLVTPTAAQLAQGDVAPLVNGVPTPDGKIDLGDVAVILRRAVGALTW
jgi:hypothetical protein